MTDLGRTLNAKRNLISGLINKIIVILGPFLIRTLIIYKLGSEFNGLSGLFTSILQVLNLTELGIGSAITFSMYKPIAEGNNNVVCSLIAFFRKMYRIIGLIVLIVGLSITPFLKYLISDINTLPISYLQLQLLYIIYLFNTVIGYFLFAHKTSLLTVNQRNDIVSGINSAVYIIGYLSQILILIFLSTSAIDKYFWYVLIIPLMSISCNVVNGIVTKKLYPQFSCKGKLEKNELKAMTKQLGGLVISKACIILRNSADSIFISTFLGTIALSIYGNYFYIMNSVHVIMGVIGVALVAGVGNSIVKETIAKNYSDFKKVLFLYSWIAGFCSTCLLCLYQPFMNIWMNGDSSLIMPFSTVILFVCYFYSMTMADVRNIYVDALGIWWKNKWRAIIETAFNVIFDLILVWFIGINGSIIATIASLLLINFTYGSYILFKNYFGLEKMKEYFISHLIYFCVTCAICVGTYFLSTLIVLNNQYLALAVIALLCILLPNFGFWILYRWLPQYKDSIIVVKRIFHFKKNNSKKRGQKE